MACSTGSWLLDQQVDYLLGWHPAPGASRRLIQSLLTTAASFATREGPASYLRRR
jgi:hypothetical protein